MKSVFDASEINTMEPWEAFHKRRDSVLSISNTNTLRSNMKEFSAFKIAYPSEDLVKLVTHGLEMGLEGTTSDFILVRNMFDILLYDALRETASRLGCNLISLQVQNHTTMNESPPFADPNDVMIIQGGEAPFVLATRAVMHFFKRHKDGRLANVSRGSDTMQSTRAVNVDLESGPQSNSVFSERRANSTDADGDGDGDS